MNRLLQGDVGSGKTVVAALAASQAIGSGAQAALMAPTEILAEQHLASFAPGWSASACVSPGSPVRSRTRTSARSGRRSLPARSTCSSGRTR